MCAPDASAEELVATAMTLGKHAEWLGLSPHAPYTASPRLSQLAAAQGVPLTMHLAESHEEMEMFRDGRGPLFDFLQSLGRPMDDCGEGLTPLATMLHDQPLDERWIIAHLNELTRRRFRAAGARSAISRRSLSAQHRYFRSSALFARTIAIAWLQRLSRHRQPREQFDSLSLFAEMRALREAHPLCRHVRSLEMATVNGAPRWDKRRSGGIAPVISRILLRSH